MDIEGITIRNLDDEMRMQLRWCAAVHGYSIEDEALTILCQAVAGAVGPIDLASVIGARFAPLDGLELEIPPRNVMCTPRFK